MLGDVVNKAWIGVSLHNGPAMQFWKSIPTCSSSLKALSFRTIRFTGGEAISKVLPQRR